MKAKLALLVVAIALAAGLTNNAFAHTHQVVGDYTVEVGWQSEPAIAGVSNAITVAITPATEDEKANAEPMDDAMSDDTMSHDEEHASDNDTVSTEEVHDHEEVEEGPLENGVTGLESILDVTVTLDDKKTTLTMTEDPNNSGMYIGEYIPSMAGYPTVHVFTIIGDAPIEATFHPEEVEDGASFDEVSSDGSINVNVVTTAPTKDEEMTVKLAFTDADGNPVENVNYDVIATQNGQSVLEESGIHTDGEDTHSTSALSSDDPVDVQIKILGIGLPDDHGNWLGPQEELSTIHVTPEFGPIVMAMFGIAIVATIGLRSKIPKF